MANNNFKRDRGSIHKKPRFPLLSIAATVFAILYTRGFTVGQLNVLGNLFQAIGEQMVTISAIMRPPFDENSQDIILSRYSRNQFDFLMTRLNELDGHISSSTDGGEL